MTSRAIGAALILFLAPAIAPAQQSNAPEFSEDGRRIVRLLELCTSADTAVCDSYIDGFVDGYWISNTHSFDMFPSRKSNPGLTVNRMADRVFKRGICLPDGVRISTLRRVLVEYLRERQVDWQNVWYQNQLWGAFNREWPCTIDTEENTDTR